MALVKNTMTMVNDGGGKNVSGSDKRSVANPLPSTTLGATNNITAPGLSMVDNLTGINTGTVYDQVVNDWHQPPAVTAPPADTTTTTTTTTTPPAVNTPPAATTPVVTPPAEQAPTEQVPTGNGDRGGGNVVGGNGGGQVPSYTDYRKEVEAMYAKQQEAKLAALEQTYLAQMAAIDKQAATIPQYYYEAGRQVSGQNAREQQAMNERFAAMGLNSGAAGQAALAQSAAYQGNVAAIKQAEANALAAIEADRTALAVQYQAAIREAILNNESEKASALYQEMLRLDEGMVKTALAQVEIDFKNQARADEIAAQNRKAFDEKAATMAAIGDFSLYAEKGYTPEQIAALTAVWQAENGIAPGGSNTGGYVGGYTAPDGWTTQDIKDFQAANGLAVDGIWGPQTQNAFDKGGGYVPPAPTTPSMGVVAGQLYGAITKGGMTPESAALIIESELAAGRISQTEADALITAAGY